MDLMKYLLKFLQIFVSFIIILSSGCNKDDNIIPHGLTTTWKVISFDDNITMIKIYKTDTNTWPQFNNGDITVSFTKSGPSSGEISGRNVTNGFSGQYEISPVNKIVIRKLLWTTIGEPTWGQLFHSIESAESYKLDGDNLVIYYNQNKNSITLEKVNN